MNELKEELVKLAKDTQKIYRKLDKILDELDDNEIDMVQRLLLSRIKIDTAHNEYGLMELSKLL